MEKTTIDEVFSVTPTGQVLTFDNLAKARMTLLNQYHQYIVTDINDFIKRYSVEQMKDFLSNTLKCDIHEPGLVKKLGMYTTREELGKFIWPMLIAHGRRVRDSLFNKNVANALSTHDLYFCDYEPGIDPVRDLNYTNLPPQAQVLVNLLIDNVKPCGGDGMPEYRLQLLVNHYVEKGFLVTRQSGWQVFNYYKPQLIARGFLKIVKAGGLK
jgi:hypothetical protein